MELKTEKVNKFSDQQFKADQVEVTFYTDPLCCWSWGFEPQWRKLLYMFGEQISVRYVMSGLIPSWKNFNDPVFSVSRPMQMGAVWMEASQTSGMPMQDKIWVNNPPASSFPACIAVKCVQLQSEIAAVKYLRKLREAVMIEGKNIAKQDVLVNIAEKLAADLPGSLDIAQFQQDLTSDTGLDAFRADWQEVQNRNITRFPSLIVRGANKQAIMITGYRPYPVLLEAIKQVAPKIEPVNNPTSNNDYQQYWGTMTQRELDELQVQ